MNKREAKKIVGNADTEELSKILADLDKKDFLFLEQDILLKKACKVLLKDNTK